MQCQRRSESGTACREESPLAVLEAIRAKPITVSALAP
jgi:hypothetical protein